MQLPELRIRESVERVTGFGTLKEFLERLLRVQNEHNDRMRSAINANDGSAIRWEDTTLPTAEEKYAGRFLYLDKGRTADDEIHVCYWDNTGGNWAWHQIV